jgi:sugar transferase (PEP-CTERM/EpsH1 system associated)
VRILFLTHRLPYAPNRGDRIRAYHIVRLLARSHHVDLVSLIHDDNEMAHVSDLKEVAGSVTGLRVDRFRNLLSAARALPRRQPLTHALLHSPHTAAAFRKYVIATPPDVVVAYCTGMARYALEPPLDRFPFVLDMVDVDSEKWAELGRTTAAPRSWIFRRESILLRKFEQEAVARARKTIVVNERERVILDRISPDASAVVIGNGVDVSSYASPTSPRSEPCVVFCGVFDYGPNEAGAVWMAREVWPLVTRAVPEARLVLVGMRPSRAVRACASDPSIRVTGTVADVRPYLWDAAISVAPIWLARGVQNKVLEAIASGLPTVVTPPVFEGLPVPVRPACRVADTPSAFAETVTALLREPPDVRRRIAGCADVSSLTWSAQLAPLLPVVEAAAAPAIVVS